MRFDNPIKDHWFKLTDIAEFPELQDEWRLTEECETEIEQMNHSVSTKNFTIFADALNKILQKSSNVEALPDENKYLTWRDSNLSNYFNHVCGYRRHSSIQPSQVFDELFENGVYTTTVDTKSLNEKLKADIEKLDNMVVDNPRVDRYDRMKECGPDIVNDVNEIFEKRGMNKAASLYNGRAIRVQKVVLLFSKPNDVHYRGFMLDCKKEPETICYHIDPKEDTVKAMLYLNDIDENAGPFSYVPTSNRFMIDPVQQIFGRSITTGSYCHNPAARRSVFRLPKKLRVSYNFGRLLLDGSDMSNKILSKHDVYTSDKANCVLFDPGAGIHRGAFCKSKNRVALQVLMR